MNIKSPENKMKEVIFDNLDKKTFKVFLFGSRAIGKYKKKSDYDIGILGKKRLSFGELMRIKNKLKKLPYLIDLVDFNAVDNDFKKIALNKIIKWN